MNNPGDATLAAYEAGVEQYLNSLYGPGPDLLGYLDRLAALVQTGQVLEVGSGSGREADHLETSGLRVLRTDAATGFVDLLRAAGHDARLLDVRTAPLGGPYQAIMANAVLLHLTRTEFEDVLQRARHAVVNDGVLGFTLKKGDGEAWTNDKLDLPRHFTYWQEPAVRQVAGRTGWSIVSIDHVTGRSDEWLYVLARRVR